VDDTNSGFAGLLLRGAVMEGRAETVEAQSSLVSWRMAMRSCLDIRRVVAGATEHPILLAWGRCVLLGLRMPPFIRSSSVMATRSRITSAIWAHA